VIRGGRTVTEVAGQWGVSGQTVHAWLAKYEAGGLEGLADASRRPRSCPHQMSAAAEAALLDMRRVHPYWGARRIAWELVKRHLVQANELPSESGVYRCLPRAGVIDPNGRQRRERKWKRWERGRPNELWQMDLVGGFLLADSSRAKALTGIDDHSRYSVSARLRPRTEPSQSAMGSRRRCAPMGCLSSSSPTWRAASLRHRIGGGAHPAARRSA
jgi:transposase